MQACIQSFHVEAWVTVAVFGLAVVRYSLRRMDQMTEACISVILFNAKGGRASSSMSSSPYQ